MYDDLYEPAQHKAWIDQISPELREWLDGLADHIVAHGEPIWGQVYRRVKTLHPDDAPKTASTVRDAVRRLVSQRG
jgi:hypothetical protein